MPDQKPTLQDALRHGLTLLEATDVHAPKSLARKLSKISPPADPYIYPSVEKMTEGMDAARRSEIIKAAKDISSSWAQMRKRQEIVSEILNHISHKLSTGELIAFGYEAAAPKLPARLPAYLFEHNDFIDWQNSSVKGNALQYLSVKILSPDQISILDQNAGTADHGQSSEKGGRPTSKIRVSQAIWALMKSNKNFLGLPIKMQITEVTNYILKNHPDEFPGNRSLNYKTVGTHIRKFRGRKLPPKT